MAVQALCLAAAMIVKEGLSWRRNPAFLSSTPPPDPGQVTETTLQALRKDALRIDRRFAPEPGLASLPCALGMFNE